MQEDHQLKVAMACGRAIRKMGLAGCPVIITSTNFQTCRWLQPDYVRAQNCSFCPLLSIPVVPASRRAYPSGRRRIPRR